MPEPPAEDRQSRLEAWLTRVGTAAGSLAAVAGFVYLIGGVVMWLRFKKADIPADQGVAVMSREQLFVVGFRLMVIPLLVIGTIAVVLTNRGTRKPDKASRLVETVALTTVVAVAALLVVWAFAVADWPSGLAVALDLVVIAGGAAGAVAAWSRHDDRLRPLRRPAAATAAAAGGLAIVLCLALPEFHVDRAVGPRLALAGAAVALILLPAGIVAAMGRLARPGARALTGLVVAFAAVELSVVAHAPWWLATALGLGLGAAAALRGLSKRSVGLAGVAGLVTWSIAIAEPWPSRLAIMLGGGVLAGLLALGYRGLRIASRGNMPIRPAWAGYAVLVLLLGLVVPWSVASATWPLGVLLVVGVWYRRRGRLREVAGRGDEEATVVERRRMQRAIAATAVVAAAIVSLGRQFDEPVQLLHASVVLKEQSAAIEGVYLNSTGDAVYIGTPTGRSMRFRVATCETWRWDRRRSAHRAPRC